MMPLLLFVILFIMFSHLFTISLIVILLAHPAEVGRAVVAGVAVHMIDCRLFFWIIIRAERLSNQSADKIMFSFPAAGQADTIISFVVFERSEQLRHFVLQTLTAAQIGNQVFIVIAFYW